MTKPKTILEYALTYHRRGWCIIPIGFDKKPPKGFKWTKYQTVRPTEADLREWFAKYKSLAVVCGAVSGGLTVLDFDSMEVYERLVSIHPELAELSTVKTSRGRHVYLRSKLNKSTKFGKIDLLSEKKCAMLPPSPHPKGGKYEWLIPLDGELPELDPMQWNLQEFPEETEDPEDAEDPDDAERPRSHSGGGVLLEVYGVELVKEIEKAVAQTIPNAKGQRNDAVFPFCRWLKAIPEIKDLPLKQLKPIVQYWYEQANPVIGTKKFTVTWADFVHGWKRVKWPKGDVMLSQAIKRALELKDVPREAGEYDSEEARLLLRVCYQLQQGAGSNPFFLASRTAGGIIGMSHRWAYKLLEMFVTDEKLQVVEEHTTTKAPRYRYLKKPKEI
jgi:hypothetical protein